MKRWRVKGDKLSQTRATFESAVRSQGLEWWSLCGAVVRHPGNIQVSRIYSGAHPKRRTGPAAQGDTGEGRQYKAILEKTSGLTCSLRCPPGTPRRIRDAPARRHWGMRATIQGDVREKFRSHLFTPVPAWDAELTPRRAGKETLGNEGDNVRRYSR